MTYWQEEDSSTPYQVPDDIVDVVFELRGNTIPLDHSALLANALGNVIPNNILNKIGIHQIRVAESGNGWQRPQAEINLSRRTKLVLRSESRYLDDLQQLCGSTIFLNNSELKIGRYKTRQLSNLPTLFSHGVACDAAFAESDFIEWTADSLRTMGIAVRKLLCGMSGSLSAGTEEIATRSLLVADLKPDESVQLQQQGLGPSRELGCGLFIPHKGIEPVHAAKT